MLLEVRPERTDDRLVVVRQRRLVRVVGCQLEALGGVQVGGVEQPELPSDPLDGLPRRVETEVAEGLHRPVALVVGQPLHRVEESTVHRHAVEQQQCAEGVVTRARELPGFTCPVPDGVGVVPHHWTAMYLLSR